MGPPWRRSPGAACLALAALAPLAHAQGPSRLRVPALPDTVAAVDSAREGRVDLPTWVELPEDGEIVPLKGDPLLLRRDLVERTHWYISAAVCVYCATVALGTLILKVCVPLKRLCVCDVRSTYSALLDSQPQTREELLEKKRVQALWTLAALLLSCALVIGTVVWCARTDRLEPKTGLDIEVYFLVFCWGCLWMLVQAVLAFCTASHYTRYGLGTFVEASLFWVVPYTGDLCDILKDAILGGFYLQATHASFPYLGCLALLYIPCVRAAELRDAEVLEDLTRAYLGVYKATQVTPLASPVELQGCLPFVRQWWHYSSASLASYLHKQTTWDKQRQIVFEDAPFVVLAIVYTWVEGYRPFVLFLNCLLPLVRLKLAFWLDGKFRRWTVYRDHLVLSRALFDGDVTLAEDVLGTLWEDVHDYGCKPVFYYVMANLPDVVSVRFTELELDFHTRSNFLVKTEGMKLTILWQMVMAANQHHDHAENPKNLPYFKLGLEGRRLLAEGLRGLRHLTALILNFESGLESETGCAIWEAIGQLPLLTSLDFEIGKFTLGHGSADAIGSCLRRLPRLQTVRLELRGTRLNTHHLKEICGGLETLSELTALTLGLAENEINDNGVGVIGKMLGRLPQLRSLTLHLTSNPFQRPGVDALAGGLRGLAGLELLELRVRFVHVEDEGAQALAGVLPKLESLEDLYLNLTASHVTEDGKRLLEEACDELPKLSKDQRQIVLTRDNFGQYTSFAPNFRFQKSQHLASIMA